MNCEPPRKHQSRAPFARAVRIESISFTSSRVRGRLLGSGRAFVFAWRSFRDAAPLREHYDATTVQSLLMSPDCRGLSGLRLKVTELPTRSVSVDKPAHLEPGCAGMGHFPSACPACCTGFHWTTVAAPPTCSGAWTTDWSRAEPPWTQPETNEPSKTLPDGLQSLNRIGLNLPEEMQIIDAVE